MNSGFKYSAFLLVIGLILIATRKKEGFQPITLHHKRNYFFEIFFSVQFIFSNYLALKGGKIDSSIIKLWALYFFVMLLIITYKEYRFRNHRSIYFYTNDNIVFEELVGAILSNNNIAYEKNQYTGWTKDGFKYSLLDLPQELYLFVDKYEYTHMQLRSIAKVIS